MTFFTKFYDCLEGAVAWTWFNWEFHCSVVIPFATMYM